MKTVEHEHAPRAEQGDMLHLHELDAALIAMYFGWKGITREADDILARFSLGRAHYRIIFIIARRDGLTVGELQKNLGITPQALQRPLKLLLDREIVTVSRKPANHRFKALHLSTFGREIESIASDAERNVIMEAFAKAGAPSVDGWKDVMHHIAKEA